MGTAGDLRRGMRIISLLVLMAVVVGPTSSMSFGPFELPVGVEERPGLVRLRVHLPRDVPESSLEVEIRGRNVVVLGRNLNGMLLRSREIPLSQSVSPAGVEVEFATDGVLVITLHAVAEGGL